MKLLLFLLFGYSFRKGALGKPFFGLELYAVLRSLMAPESDTTTPGINNRIPFDAGRRAVRNRPPRKYQSTQR
jgi:hypothetical protein